MTETVVTFDKVGFRRAVARTVLRSLVFAVAFTPSCDMLYSHGCSGPMPSLAVTMLHSEHWLVAGLLPIVMVWIVLVLNWFPSRLSFMRVAHEGRRPED